MSSTNRGGERRANDFYETPVMVAKQFVYGYLEQFTPEYLAKIKVLEPCAGGGNIVRALRQSGIGGFIDAIEIDEQHKENLFAAGATGAVVGQDCLTFSKWPRDYDLIITNPPYSIAQEIIERCFEIAPQAVVVMLLRLGFLESEKRREFWAKHPVNDLYVLTKRPSFTGGGNDSCAYAWYVWKPGCKEQHIYWI